MGVWAKGWVSGQDLSTAAQGSASNLSCSGIRLRVSVSQQALSTPGKGCLCPTATPPLGQNSLFIAWAAPCHWSAHLVASNPWSVSWVPPIFSILPDQPWPSPPRASSARVYFPKMHVTFCLDSPPAPSCAGAMSLLLGQLARKALGPPRPTFSRSILPA